MNGSNPNENHLTQLQQMEKRVRERMAISKMRIIGNIWFPYDPSLNAVIGTVNLNIGPVDQEGSPN